MAEGEELHSNILSQDFALFPFSTQRRSLSAIQNHRTGGVEQHLVLVGVKLAHREAAAGREPAERVGNPRWQARYIVEGEHVAIAGGDEQVAILARQSAQGRGVRIEQRGLPVYLETAKESNVALYLKLGFKVVGE